ncbi:MAG TPA: SDR family oxidoreductase [Myxococcales bacterium]|nr:SDR family oxidoreductase [Myxococcales bacterium]
MLLLTGFPRLLARRMAQALSLRGPVTVLAQEKHAERAGSLAATLREGRMLIGDVASMHLGLSTAEYRELTQECTGIVHAAEWSWLGADPAMLERVNIGGTRNMLEMAVDCRKLRRFTHFSTVFVSGDRAGVIAEDELSAGQSFRNAYEQTMFEAEMLVRRAMGQLPCAVLRTAFLVGDSTSGEIDRFEGPYIVAGLLLSKRFQVPLPLPLDGVAPLNVVPVDFVARAAAAIHQDPRAVGRTFHIVDPNPSSSRRVYERVAEREGKKLPRLSLGYKLTDRLLKLPGLEKLTREQRIAFATVNHLAFYSSRNTLEILDGTGIRCPPIESYLDKLIDYAQKARAASP